MIGHQTAAEYARQMKVEHRRFLEAHIDGIVPLNRKAEPFIKRSLLARGFIAYTQVSGARQTAYPTHTRITEKGRMVLAAILADQIEQIIAATEALNRLYSPTTVPTAAFKDFLVTGKMLATVTFEPIDH